MRLKLIKSNTNELQIEIQGEGHSFCNALQSILLSDDRVEFCGYGIQHPLISQPILTVRTKDKAKPKDVLIDAARLLKEEMDETCQRFASALEAYEKSRNR